MARGDGRGMTSRCGDDYRLGKQAPMKSRVVPRVSQPSSACRPSAFEMLEPRLAMAASVSITAPINDVSMSLGSAAQAVVVRLPDHFASDGSLTYSVATQYGYVATDIDAGGNLRLRNAPTNPRGFATAIDNLVVRAALATDPATYRELAFSVFQKATVRLPNAVIGETVAGTWFSTTTLGTGSNPPRLNAPTRLDPPSGTAIGRVVGDFNGDHADDIAWLKDDGSVWVVAAAGQTGFSAASPWGSFSTTTTWQSPTSGDFNGDGRIDITARDAQTGRWHVLSSTGTAFTQPRDFGAWATRVTWGPVVTGDFDGNAKTDLAARDPATGVWWISRSTGTGFVTTPFRGLVKGLWNTPLVGDFNGDGRTDLAARNQESGVWRVFLSRGTDFDAGKVFGSWTTGIDWHDMLVGDFDADGRSDIAARNPHNGKWIVARSTGSTFAMAWFSGLGSNAAWQSFIACDLNFDGRTDLLARNVNTGHWRLLASTGSGFRESTIVGTWEPSQSWTRILPLRLGYVQTGQGAPVSSGSLSVGSLNVISRGSGSLISNPEPPPQSPTLSVTSGNTVVRTGIVAGGESIGFLPGSYGVLVVGRPATGSLTLSGSQAR